MSRRLTRRRKVGYALLALLAVLLAMLAFLALAPPNLGALRSQPDPAPDYAAAVARVSALQAAEAPLINPECATRLLTHGQATARVTAFIHGYTNCPQQFADLGQQFYDLGYNVLILRMPHHGLADRLTDDLTNFTAEEMAVFADQVVDLAAPLGDHLTVVGLSGGGTIAGWAAQQRPEVDQAVLIAPGFSLKLIPDSATQLFINVALRLPDRFSWWDPTHPNPPPGGPMGHAYPRFSLHGLAQQLRLGLAVRALARRAAPAAAGLLLITNANDISVDNAVAAQVLADWQAHGATVDSFEFPANLRLGHDLIDPGQSDQQVALVYPQLIALINR
ncbi:MAG: alpha/beta fold hydrolase [Anaerolineales bacterium]|nr:alpha/beta fold hydrolase [Anaerolineales bacterium]